MLARENDLFAQRMGDLLLLNEADKVIAFYRKGLLFAFNFHPEQSAKTVRIPVPVAADYTIAFSSEDEKYGGWQRVEHQTYPCVETGDEKYIEIYLPARTAVVMKEGAPKVKPGKKK